jgi:hypothetical protein
MFIAQVHKKSNSSKLFARGIAVFYGLQKRKITNKETRKKDIKNLSRCLSPYSSPFAGRNLWRRVF